MPTNCGEGHILDPFASVPTRGIVAGCLGYQYTGLERSARKVAAYERQAILVKAKYPKMTMPKWICANPTFLDDLLDQHLPADARYDLVFTDVPIYGPKQTAKECMAECEKVLQMAVARLRRNRFAVFMARSVCAENGFIQFSFSDVVSWLPDKLGLHFYNEGVLRMSGVAHETLVCFHNFDDQKKIPQEVGVLNEIDEWGY